MYLSAKNRSTVGFRKDRTQPSTNNDSAKSQIGMRTNLAPDNQNLAGGQRNVNSFSTY